LADVRSKFTLKRIAGALLAACVVLYAGDFLSLRLGIPHRDQLGSVTMHTFYAVKLKNGKTEYDYAGDQVVNCSNSLFPQMGVSPCWYAIRHTDQQITIDSGNPNNPHVF
jgi:hypothetical protein